MTYTITSTASCAESEREQLRREAARAVYAELVKYYNTNDKKETERCAAE